MTRASSIRVSVIVPVFGPSPFLASCLEALESQDFPAGEYEVIVVDNNDPPELAEVVARFQQARLVCETRPSSYAARNAGIRQALGKLLAFTDADCIPERDWLRRGVQQLESCPDLGMLGGRIAFEFMDPNAPTVVELYEAAVGFRQRDYLERDGFAATANMFTRRCLFNELGLFDGSLKSSGDVEWGCRVRSSGASQRYDADVVVRHPARRSLEELRRKFIRLGGGMQDLARKNGQGLRALVVRVPMDFLPLGTLAKCLADPRLRGLGDRVRMAGVVMALGATLGVERIRVQLGGTSRRA